ncbi:MAG: DMT family transporter [Fibrobacteres bacterium]|nr:DMT family transporter [Fibrobacterota bacterium]
MKYLYVVISTISFGSMAIFAKFAYRDGADVQAVLFLRFFIAGVVMAGIMALKKYEWPKGRTLLVLIGMGAVGYFSQAYALFGALNYASAGLVSLLLYVYPVLTVIISSIIIRKVPSLAKIAIILAAITGTILTIGGELNGKPLGIILALTSACIYSVYLLTGEKVLSKVHPFAAATVIMLSASVVFGFLVLVNAPRFPVSVTGWGASVSIAIISTVIAMVAVFSAIRAIGAPDTAILSTLEPFFTIMLASIFLGESIRPLQIAGGLVIVASAISLIKLNSRKTL